MYVRLANTAVILVILLCPAAAVCGAQVPEVTRLPNVVLIAIDTLRSDHLGCYGYRRDTSPNIDRLASEGVLFERCYSAASWTPPVFMSIFTGLMPAAHGCWNGETVLSPAIPTLPERFKERGYFCGAVVSNPHLGGKFGFGRGFDTYDDYSVFLQAETGLFDANTKEKPESINDARTGVIVTQHGKALIDGAKRSGKPFFLFFHYFDPHDSYIPPPPYDAKFTGTYTGRQNGRGIPTIEHAAPTGEDLQHLIDLYDGEIAYTDVQVGELLRKLDEVGSPQDTLIIFVSDHGEAFGEHGLLRHGHNAYQEEVRVPMIWRWPGVLPKGHRVTAPVSNLDITKTLKELMRFKGLDLVQGRSLWPGLLGGQLSTDEAVFSESACDNPWYLAVTQDRLRGHVRFFRDKGVGAKDATFELYDISRDPSEKTNLVDRQPERTAEMKKSLTGLWSECLETHAYYQGKAPSPGVTMTDQERRRLESLGYIGGRK